MKNSFNRDLCKRFVSDNNIPMPIPHDEKHFFYYINLYEPLYHSRSLWDSLCEEIEIAFNGNVTEFLDFYYETRDNMITGILNNPKYQEFLKTDMSQYAITNKELKNIPKGNVYNGENIGKCFISIDLNKANFQALRYFDKSLVNDKSSYEEYVDYYTFESDYIKKSKYTRQVVFGKCNPARQITIEKYLMAKFYDNFEYNKDIFKLVRFNNDELVFEIVDYHKKEHIDKYLILNGINYMVNKAKKASGVDVSCEIYTLRSACLHSKYKNEDRHPFYILENEKYKFADCKETVQQYKFKEVPLTYHSIIYKLWNNIPLYKEDYYFNYEGLSAYIDDEFTLKNIGKTEEFANCDDNKEEY